MKQILSKKEAAQELGISAASINNWVRHGYITDENNTFHYSEILSVKKKIETGEIDRLNKRANKSSANNKFIPDEYISSKESIVEIAEIIDFIHSNNIQVEQALFLLAINLFIQTGDIIDKDLDNIFKFEKSNFRRSGVYNHISTWLKKVSSGKINYNNEKVRKLLTLNLPAEKDVLGIIYQSILNEGKKSNLGSYYTPEKVVDSIVEGNIASDSTVLDPCCGTGQFLLSFCKYIDDPANIYGFDIDQNAINVAKINLLLFYSAQDFEPNIIHMNTLLLSHTNSLFENEDDFSSKFDFIATNPPWGAKYDKEDLAQIKMNFRGINTKESFSFFICQSSRFLKDHGRMCFVLPESITNVKTHYDIRNFIDSHFNIEKIDILGKCFKKVLSSVIIIQMVKGNEEENIITVKNRDNIYSINQKRFNSNKNCIFDIYVNETDNSIFGKVEAYDNFTLENNADWALGIVTGDNNKFIKSSISNNEEPIYKGSDIVPFKFKEASNFIKYEPELFQQVAPTEKYRVSEKIVYRFISSNLVFAYDNNHSLTLNSANIIIPKVEGFSMKYILGFLNSKLFNYYFKKKFNSIKILRGDIEQLPFPKLHESEKKKFEDIVDGIIDNQLSIKTLDEAIFGTFNLTSNEIDYIEKYLIS